MLEKLAPYAKAILGFIAPGAIVIIAAVTAGSDGGTDITQAEWITAACSAIITGAGVYAVPNKGAVSSPEPPRG